VEVARAYRIVDRSISATLFSIFLRMTMGVL